MILFIWLHWAFLAVCRRSLVVVSRSYLILVFGLLTAVASLVVEHGLKACRLQ